MVTIEEIFENMKNIYAEKTGYEINETADMAVRMYAAAAQICSLYAYNDWVMKQAFPQTATGENLEYHAQIRGLYRNGGNKATGKITFGVDEQATSDLTIPRPVLYKTTPVFLRTFGISDIEELPPLPDMEMEGDQMKIQSAIDLYLAQNDKIVDNTVDG